MRPDADTPRQERVSNPMTQTTDYGALLRDALTASTKTDNLIPLLVDGLEDLADKLDLKLDAVPRDYSTVSGLVLAELERIPTTGDTLRWRNLVIEVVDMDGRRIDKLLIRRDST